jgi:hypothetical protein
MDTKLTLRIDKDIIEKIKIFASREKKSLSDLTEDLYKIYIVNASTEEENKIDSPIAKKYKSIINSNNFDYENQKFSNKK